MPTQRKELAVSELTKKLSRAKVAILTDYRGLTVSDLNQLRRRMIEAGVEYQVVKNTLTRIAAEAVDKQAVVPMLQGPTAIAFGYDDEVKPARVLAEYLRATPRTPLAIKGGILDRAALTVAQVNALAALPSRPEMLARVMGGLNAPAANLVSALSGGVRMLVYALEARRTQLEEQEAESAA